MSKPFSPPPVTESATGDLPAYVSNGLIGLRVLDIPLLPGMAMVSGLSGRHPVVEVEAAAQAPYPVAGDIALNGEWLTATPHQAVFEEQRYDFSNGELTTRFRFEAADARAEVEVLAFCSRSDPTLVLQETSVTVSSACDLTMRALVDPTTVHGSYLRRHTATPGEPDPAVDGSLCWETLGGLSKCGVAYITEFRGSEDATRTRQEWGTESQLATDYSVRARAGRRYRLRQIASVVPSRMHNEPDQQAVRLVGQAHDAGFDALRETNRAAWETLWKGRVLLHGADERWQALADAAFFYINSSVHPSAPSSTSMFGLAMYNNYHYYYGHVMWDIETFCVPPLLFFQPEAARSMLEYRLECLPAARANARLNGRRGVQFPWESGPERGEESAPGAGKASWYEDHVTLDVALAFAVAAHMTGGKRMEADTAQVLYGVADWVASRATPQGEGFGLLQTMGIAERPTPSDNDAYTIMAAKVVLDETVAAAERLGDDISPSWEQVRAGLTVRPSESGGPILTHDGFQPGEQKGGTPGPLAGLFPVWFDPGADVERATLDYYLGLAPKYIGSPMLSSLYGTWAAWAGDRALSARLLEEGYAAMVGGRFLQTLEMDPAKFPDTPRAGPFFANMGGFMLGLLFGMPGIRPTHEPVELWPCRPVVLPDGWDAIEVEQLNVRRRRGRLVARHGEERASLTLR